MVNEVDNENDTSNLSENDIEIDLAYYENMEDFELSVVVVSLASPKKLRKLRLSRLENLTLPSIHLLYTMNAMRSLFKGLGSIPNIKLSYLPDLTSLEGSGPGNQFVQLLHLTNIEDFSPVSRSRKLAI